MDFSKIDLGNIPWSFGELNGEYKDTGTFDAYWSHLDFTREDYIGWCLLGFHIFHFSKFDKKHY